MSDASVLCGEEKCIVYKNLYLLPCGFDCMTCSTFLSQPYCLISPSSINHSGYRSITAQHILLIPAIWIRATEAATRFQCSDRANWIQRTVDRSKNAPTQIWPTLLSDEWRKAVSKSPKAAVHMTKKKNKEQEPTNWFWDACTATQWWVVCMYCLPPSVFDTHCH